MKQILKKQDIYAYTTKNETKANDGERVIQTLQGLMYHFFIHHQTYAYLHILQDLVSNYNHRPHTSLKGLSPVNISKSNKAKIWKHMYIDTLKLTKKKRKSKLKVNDKVPILHLKYIFNRNYQEQWTEEIFIITHRHSE